MKWQRRTFAKYNGQIATRLFYFKLCVCVFVCVGCTIFDYDRCLPFSIFVSTIPIQLYSYTLIFDIKFRAFNFNWSLSACHRMIILRNRGTILSWTFFFVLFLYLSIPHRFVLFLFVFIHTQYLYPPNLDVESKQFIIVLCMHSVLD